MVEFTLSAFVIMALATDKFTYTGKETRAITKAFKNTSTPQTKPSENCKQPGINNPNANMKNVGSTR